MTTYTIQRQANIRKTPIVNWTNRVGVLTVGKNNVEVLETHVDLKGWTWGRITRPDASGNSHWFCIQSMNYTYALPNETPNGKRVARIVFTDSTEQLC